MDMATNMWLKDMAWERRDEPIDRSIYTLRVLYQRVNVPWRDGD
jgi:hypothetical protein